MTANSTTPVAAAATTNPLALSEDTIDDLLYCARTNDAAELETTLAALSAELKASVADVLVAAVDAESGNNVLHFAAGNGWIDILNLVLKAFGDASPSALVDSPNGSGNTPLHWAALNGHLPFVQALVSRAGAKTSVCNAAGLDPIAEAERASREDVVLWLLAEGDEPAPVAESSADAEQDLGDDTAAAAPTDDGVTQGVDKLSVADEPKNEEKK